MGLDPSEVVRRLHERLTHRPPDDLAAEAAAKALVPELARTLRAAGAKRVVLFGSLAYGLFRRSSDIDLAVAGLTEGALATFERELTIRAGRLVELANLDSASAPLKESIERFGVEIT